MVKFLSTFSLGDGWGRCRMASPIQGDDATRPNVWITMPTVPTLIRTGWEYRLTGRLQVLHYLTNRRCLMGTRQPSIQVNLHRPVVSNVQQLETCLVLRLNDDHGQPSTTLFFENTTGLLAFVTGIVSKAGLTYFEWERPEPVEVCHIEFADDDYGYADAIDVLL